jgi:UrcA family protein
MIRFVAALLFTALPLSAAQAAPIFVQHGDLNLSDPADVLVLRARVLEAAEAACGSTRLPDFGVTARILYKAKAERRTCIRQTADRTLARILRPTGLA